MLTKLSDKNAIHLCHNTINESDKRLHFLNNQLSKLRIEESNVLEIPLGPDLVAFLEREHQQRHQQSSSTLSRANTEKIVSNVSINSTLTIPKQNSLKKVDTLTQFSFRNRRFQNNLFLPYYLMP